MQLCFTGCQLLYAGHSLHADPGADSVALQHGAGELGSAPAANRIAFFTRVLTQYW